MTLLRLYDKTTVISLSLSTARALRVDFAGRLTPTDLSNSSLIFFLVVLLFCRFESVEPETKFCVCVCFFRMPGIQLSDVSRQSLQTSSALMTPSAPSVLEGKRRGHTVCTLMLSHLARLGNKPPRRNGEK
jgi:hypothetical protein